MFNSRSPVGSVVQGHQVLPRPRILRRRQQWTPRLESGAMNTEALTGQQVDEAGLEGWAFLLSYGLFGLQTRIHTQNFAAGLQVAGAIGEAATDGRTWAT